MLTRKELYDVYARIKPFIHRTPLTYSNAFSNMAAAEVYIKAENLQKTGAYKVRGVFNKIAGLGSDRVVTASMGNHAQAVAYAAKILGMQAKIIMPITVSIIKEQATRSYGADVILHGDGLQAAIEYAMAQEGYAFIHPFDDDEIIAGQSTVGLEIVEDMQNIDTILAPVGGGGLIAGIALAVKKLSPGTEIIGVQTEAAQSAYRSFHGNKIIAFDPQPTIADGIAVGRVGEKTFPIIKELVDDMVLVNEEEIAVAVLLFMERKKLIVEGAGAVPLAAFLANKDRFKGKWVVLVASGGNMDLTMIDRIVRKGLVTSGRINVFEVVVDDVPGSLHELTGIIAGHRVNILHVDHDRFAEDLPLGKTRLSLTVETRAREDLRDAIAGIRAGGFIVLGAH